MASRSVGAKRHLVSPTEGWLRVADRWDDMECLVRMGGGNGCDRWDADQGLNVQNKSRPPTPASPPLASSWPRCEKW